MGLGTKNRQNQTAELWKLHLWEKNPGKLPLVEELSFIVWTFLWPRLTHHPARKSKVTSQPPH